MNTLLFMMKFSLPFPFKKVKGIFTNNLQGKLRDLFISILCIGDSPLNSCSVRVKLTRLKKYTNSENV